MEGSDLVFDPLNPLKLKKTQEADEEHDVEDDLLNEDVGGNKKRLRRVPKGIDATQYNDDSSDEEEDGDDGNAKQKKEKESRKDDSDSDDMFASDDDDDEDVPKSKVKKPKVELLNIDEFEKELELEENIQVNESGEEDPDNEDQEEDIEYYKDQETEHTDRKIPRNEPKLEAFNLKNEKQEGIFDADGNYIEIDKSDNEQEDDWLNGVNKKDIKKAKDAQDERDRTQREKQVLRESRTIETLLFELIGLLQPVESPLEALQRLNKTKLKKSKKQKPSEQQLNDEKLRQGKVEQITELCETLIEKGFKEIYEFEKEELMIKYKQETGKAYVKPVNPVDIVEEKVHEQEDKSEDKAEEDNQGNNEDSKWEFRWLGDEQIHGPYTIHEMTYWKDNYFQDKVEVRKVGDTKFTDIKDIKTFS